MQKIMFKDKYGLTDAVLKGKKTMTRRFVPTKEAKRLDSFYDSDDWDYAKQTCIDDSAAYMIGEVVAVAQSYRTLEKEIRSLGLPLDLKENIAKHKGYTNKMFVKASDMPHQIRITDIKIERLHEISEEDALKEGVYGEEVLDAKLNLCYAYTFYPPLRHYETAREAFSHLIDKVGKKGTWDSNPWVFVYSFELVS